MRLFLALILLLGIFATFAPIAHADEGDVLQNYYETLDRSCKTDADCVVKDIGNCCGSFPSCVNQSAQPDLDLVKAHCEKEGIMGVCGFPSITGCNCVDGTCSQTSAVLVQ